MSKILVLARFAVGLPHAEREGAYTMIDDFYMRGTAAAQESAKRIIYGPNPADIQLKAWLHADEPVLLEMVECHEGIDEVALQRRRMGPMMGPKEKAATLPGYTVASGGSSSGGGSSAQSTPKAKGKPQHQAGHKANSQKTGGHKNTATAFKQGGGAHAGKGNSAGKAPAQRGTSHPTQKPPTTFLYSDGTHSTGARYATR